MKKLRDNWYILLIALFFAGAGLLFAIRGDRVHVGIADNLELFQAQYQMLKNTGTFFTRNAASSFLAGVTRDDLPSEWSVTAFLYMLLPSLTAYFAVYFLRILLAVLSFRLLFSLWPQYSGKSIQKALITLGGFAYGIISVFPSYGLCFASVPLIVYLLIRLDREENNKKILLWLAGIFFYPLLSYFSYFGLFILGYLLLALICLSVRRRRFCFRLLAALIVLSAGFVLFENRLFASMLFSNTVTIRSTMVPASLKLSEAISWMLSSLKDGIMHVDGVQKYLVLPVCAGFYIIQAAYDLYNKQGRRLLSDPLTLIGAVLLFNSFVYGIYYYKPFRDLVEKLLPPLTGWQFNRTIFFSPFLWYLAFVIVLLRLVRILENRAFRLTAVPVILMLLAILIIFRTPATYNDLYQTMYSCLYEWKNGCPMNELSYGEFYSTELFDRIKADLDYQEGDFRSFRLTAENDEDIQAKTEGTKADWSVAYGLYPGILEYNGIATLDGYLGFYQQSYKEAFREVIAPALETNEGSRAYFDDWGARCYLYSGNGEILVNASRNYAVEDTDLHVNIGALKSLGCRYIFSRIDIGNAEALELDLRGVYQNDNSPYTIYVYELQGEQ